MVEIFFACFDMPMLNGSNMTQLCGSVFSGDFIKVYFSVKKRFNPIPWDTSEVSPNDQ